MTTKTIPFSDGCACSAVRYESTAEPVMLLHCHCRDCQRSSGRPFSSFFIVRTEPFKLSQGSLCFHASPSETGGKTHRGFCPDCVTPIAVPRFVAIRTASLDDPSWFNPQVEVWTSGAHPWNQMNPRCQSLKSILWFEIQHAPPHLKVTMWRNHAVSPRCS